MLPNTLLQAVLFRDERDAREIGPAIWAALEEVSALYNLGQERAHFRRCFLSEAIPSSIDQEIDLDLPRIQRSLKSKDWWNTDPAGSTAESSASSALFADPELPGLEAALGTEAAYLYDSVREEFHRTVDKTVVVQRVRQLIGGVATTAPMLLVIDQELTPPPTWKYIIWDDVDWDGNRAVVVSIKPTDPRYWGMQSKDLAAVIKQRIRAACCSSVGEMLNLQLCANPFCYLFQNVESVNVLDDLDHFGGEHDIPEMSGMGYLTPENDPFKVQPLIHNG